MKVGVPREVKNNEYRVAITPAGVHELVRSGHEVVIEARREPAPPSRTRTSRRRGKILPSADEVWQTAELILKVKEPVARSITGCARARSCSRTCTWPPRGLILLVLMSVLSMA